ncbi:MAG TPA: glycosyltransferase [Herpetosiphonaceae bacterium]
MLRTTNQRTFIAWAPYGRRSELLARELGADLYFIHYLKFKVPIYAPPKYLLQAMRTLQLLLAERPRVVFAQSPPFVCGLVADWYCRLSGAHLVLDHHSDSFGPRWAWALPIQQRLVQHALVNLVTNDHWAGVVESWGGAALVLPDPFVDLPPGESFSTAATFSIAYVNTFSADEPLDAVLVAAKMIPEVHFYITGSKQKAPRTISATALPNVTFTDFLPDPQYFGLLRSAHAVMALTTRDHTLQSGGCEAVSLGKPLITSDWPYLRELFAQGALFVANTPESIAEGVRRMQQVHRDLERDVIDFRLQRRQAWEAQFARLTALVERCEYGMALHTPLR